MRKLFIITILSILAFSSCKNFLDLKPISNSSIEGFYQDANDFTNALIGAYASLKSQGVFNDDVPLIGDLRSDNTEMGTTASDRFNYDDMHNFRMNNDNKISASVWQDNYRGIVRVNQILDRIQNLEGDEQFKNQIIGEAKFLRATFFFNLVRIFGPIPLPTTTIQTVSEAYAFGRTSVDSVYATIIEDLSEAGDELPDENDAGRATKWAAKSLLGFVYLTNREPEKARDVLKEVINSNRFGILENFKDLWNPANKNNKEIIFSLQYQKNSIGGVGSKLSDRWAPYLYPYLSYYSTSGGYNIPTENLINSFEPGDERKDASLIESYVDVNGNVVDGLSGRSQIKFFDQPTEHEGSNDNFPIIRYAEVLLSYSEALNQIGFDSNPNGDAFLYLNKIRERAGLEDLTPNNSNPDFSIDSKEEFEKAMLHERRVEFAFEGKRWFDLVRTGTAIETIKQNLGIDIKETQFLLPIPLDELDINKKLEQNPGY